MFHNKYPAEWSRIAQEAVAESQGAEDDIAWFARSGTSASPGIARLFWLGDQMHTYDNFDGLQSALTAHLQGGLSGYSLSHSDVGGFTTVDTVLAHYPRTAELLQRWVEMNTFADAILRTHPGSSPGICAQVYDTPELGAHFCKFATMFRNLAPYKKSLMAEAYTVGTPMTRPLMLHYPNDARARAVSDEFMLGSELLMAPIFEVGGTSRNVYLPSGNWVNIFSKVQYACENACDVADVEAPIGSPLVFVRKGGTYFESLLGIASNINC
jgi:alpha-glucosidase